MKKANRKQRKIVQGLDYKIDEYYKTYDDESDNLFRMQTYYHEKIKEADKRNVHV